MRIHGESSDTRSILSAKLVSWILAVLFLIPLGSSHLPAQSPARAESAAPGLRSFATDGQVAEYLRHLDSIKTAACGSVLKIIRTVRTGGEGDAILRAHVTTDAGAPLSGAVLNIEKGAATTSKEDGDAVLRIAASDIASDHAVVVLTKLIGYRARRASVKVSPGDTVSVEVSLCSQPVMLQQLVVTGEGVESAATDELTTNVQSEGVDEGDIVKLSGRFLVILRRGRLFTVDLGLHERNERELRSRGSINAFGPQVDPAGTWYDELIVYRDRIIVIGYSYQRNGTELGLFRIGPNGSLRFEGTYQLRSYDYYSSRNYASRLVGGKLVFYAPLPFGVEIDGPSSTFPALRRWRAGADAKDFHSITAPAHVFSVAADSSLGGELMLHAVTSCDLDSPEFTCDARVVVGPPGRVFYVSPTAVYVWATRWSPRNDTAFDSRDASTLYRLPLDGSSPRAIRVTGHPVDQLSFEESSDGYLNVLVRSEGNGEGMWFAEQSHGSSAALLRIPLADFGDGSRRAPRSRYRLLPVNAGDYFQNRFVGDWLLYGAGNGWRQPAVSSSTLFAVRISGGDPVQVPVPHGVDRIDALGPNAIVVGSDGENLHFTGIDLSADPEIAQRYVLAHASQGELRTHGFFYERSSDSTGILGLPVRGAGSAGWAHLVEGSTSVIYLRNAGNEFAELGVLRSRIGTTVSNEADACKASCVDWYGNARPLFVNGRVFALLGYEIVEGKLEGHRLVEKRRIDFAPKSREGTQD
jgi:hypothetical protein